jgi:hypothetical protein
MELIKMKLKIISLLICALFLTSIIPGLTTAKNLVSIDKSVANSNVDLSGDRDLIKITDENPACDIDHYFVVYADSAYLYIYNIKTGETDDVYVGGDIVFPKISENRVVYYDFLYMGFKMYDINTSEKTDLIVTNWPGGGSDAFQFFGDYIVYENYDSDMYSTEIFLYHIATGENIQLTDSPGEDYPSNPCIYKNIVAWQLSESNLNDIVMYNIDSNEYTRVTNTSRFESETFPSIYDNNIVYNYLYYDKLNGTILYALKMYNITTGDETTIFSGEEPTANSPEIFSNIVVYSVPDGRLCLYNLSTNIEIQIYENSYLMQPWNLNENYVLFTVLGDGVYLYKYNNNPLNNFNITIKPGVGLGVTVIFDNDGSNDALNEPWKITVQGGFLGWINKTVNSTIDIPAGGSKTMKTGMLFGFGAITISAKIADEEQTAIGTQIIIFSMVKK